MQDLYKYKNIFDAIYKPHIEIPEQDRTLLGLINYNKVAPSLRLVRRNKNDNTSNRQSKKKKKK